MRSPWSVLFCLFCLQGRRVFHTFWPVILAATPASKELMAQKSVVSCTSAVLSVQSLSLHSSVTSESDTDTDLNHSCSSSQQMLSLSALQDSPSAPDTYTQIMHFPDACWWRMEPFLPPLQTPILWSMWKRRQMTRSKIMPPFYFVALQNIQKAQ